MKKINYLKIAAFIILISLFIVFIVNTILKFSIKRSSTLDSETLLDIEHFLNKLSSPNLSYIILFAVILSKLDK